MTDLTERLRRRIVEASPLPWVYRPDKYDDWGWIRGVEQESEIGRYRPIVANAKDSNVREDAFAQHRQNKTDPYGPNALLITDAVNALPDLLTALETLTQENARLREAGWRDIESAPRDGTRIMLWLREPWACVELALWYEPWGVWLTERYLPGETDEMGGIGADVPTHWMPLPPAPARKALGGGDEQ